MRPVQLSEEYQYLDAGKIVQAIDLLSKRIDARFPGSGLHNVSRRLHSVATRARERSEWIARPLIMLRVATAVIVGLILVTAVVAVIGFFRTTGGQISAYELVPLLEASTNVVVLLGVTVFFLITLETRYKRRRALGAIHELRSIAHVIDVHQLTKDPERLRVPGTPTPHSPKTIMTRFELGRYLDNCSEMLSLTGKVAALYVQHFNDHVAIASVSDVEQLCTSLSRKIWQKIMILPAVADPPPAPETSPPRPA